MEPQTINYKDLKWIHFSEPTQAGGEFLAKKFKFHHLDLEDCLSAKQRPKIDEYKDYLFIVIQLPERHSRYGFVKVSEVNIFIGNGYLITINHKNRNLEKLVSQFAEANANRKEYMSKGSGYLLYQIIKHLFESTFPMLDNIGAHIDKLEKEVFADSPRAQEDRLRDILVYKKDIINFRRIILHQRTVLADLGHKHVKFLPKNLGIYFDDVADTIEKMWSTLENYRDLIASIQETNESIISHNTNNVIKTLTIFSVIMLPLTFITGLYGMNLETLPFAETPLSFIIVTGGMVLIVVSMLTYFKWRRWL
ncbi:magnesium transporter CorA [Candidatus Peregrinibacteria bacterium CG11_big_fil_rev_8_21_14_0_20_41_10]|nr:MAG: magnesium transporter CorA [Candidatus Peregrinibacteria bacterium CG11_big_fil_rev_8_21_14_0_20_41_10]PIZ73053.1 MAG: magnesium transporter CorA [Candidatus Peregrinibacteria bacterium CG_4_10_14_0_2_um_filter_41_8]PJC38074.1 MAG: magnesium transporter CorA [Candidatus Peregrinibacteria bacterium CG_4_9_14_0_2_um_filter_41_14]